MTASGEPPAGGQVPPASPWLPWPREVEHLEAKTEVARRIARRARDGEVIGIGSGSATYLTLQEIGRRVAAESLAIRVVPTSYETSVAAEGLGLSLLRLGQTTPDWGIDGADEVDPDGRLLKGRGGALFREKLLWYTSPRMVLAIDPSKRVARLGTRYPIPVEVHPEAVELAAARLGDLGCVSCVLRTGAGAHAGKDGPVFTENGCVLLDVRFDEIPQGLDARINGIPGVLETGLFEGFAFEAEE